MPIYEYSCQKCGKVVDLLQKMGADKAGIVCPKCGADALAKKLSVTAPPQTGRVASAGCDMGGCDMAGGGSGGCCSGCCCH